MTLNINDLLFWSKLANQFLFLFFASLQPRQASIPK
jgi:hypothetical protein